MEKHKVLDQMLAELEEFLKILDKETLSSTAIMRKCLLSELLQSYMKSAGCDEEYICMNKVVISGQNQEQLVFERDDHSNFLTNGSLGKHSPAPQKSLPDLPRPRPCSDREPLPAPKLESPEGYYEEAQPYDTAINEDGEAVSSSYESYDEEEMTKGKSTTHQWPSSEASIELMKDVRICAFLWRKKWLGQWAKQLCVIRENRLLCYKSSKDQSPQLAVSLVGCSVVYKEKQVKKKEHKLKIIPNTGDVIVLGLQSKEQTEQWLKVIQEITAKQSEIPDGSHYTSDSPHLRCTKVEVHERHSIASESGSSTDTAETPEIKDVKKKYGAGLKLSNFMNIGKKKCSSLDSPEKCVDTSGYMNVLVNSQWRTRWCLIKNGQLYFYQDKSKNKAAHQPLSLEGCVVVPDPSPEHLYSFRILHKGEQRATLEAKSSDEMGHWLGLLLAESGSKTDPEELTYDYVDSERISCIVNAAKNSLNLMQRKYSEPNTYTDNLPAIQNDPDDIYDDVDVPEHTQENAADSWSPEQEMDRVYLDLIPVKSFLHTSPNWPSPGSSPVLGRAFCQAVDSEREGDSQPLEGPSKAFQQTDSEISPARTNNKTQTSTPEMDVDEASPKTTIKIQSQHQKTFFPTNDPQRKSTASPQAVRVTSESPDKPKLPAAGSLETRLGKGRTEAEIRRFTDERDRLEREKEQIRSSLALLRKHKRELKEDISSSKDAGRLAALESMLRDIEEGCKQKERQRVDLELNLMEVKESLKKAESGPVTLGTAVDSSLLETARLPEAKAATYTAPATANNEVSPVISATNLKNIPLSIMAANKGNVLQKAKEWEKKANS
ncbi:actin filament-associated protein 1-like 2 [Polyodon spathula]|uniref:actin filament-associated protein 1-like 2 n=1 Tax=Polyodon spathula TaxID=7913 RepID=UPI001B7E5991|nr:actin filament-associated protein 1-like 2 [Polyodon spathula]